MFDIENAQKLVDQILCEDEKRALQCDSETPWSFALRAAFYLETAIAYIKRDRASGNLPRSTQPSCSMLQDRS